MHRWNWLGFVVIFLALAAILGVLIWHFFLRP
jgi:hypothetical protein